MTDLERPKHVSYVLGFAIQQKHEDDSMNVLLLRRTKPGHWQHGRLNGLGGKVESGESPRDAMYREFGEETGLNEETANQCDWRYLITMRLFNNDVDVHVFSSRWPTFPTMLKEGEEGALEVHAIRDLPYGVMDNLHWLIPLAADSNIADSSSVDMDNRMILEHMEADLVVASNSTELVGGSDTQ